MNVFYFCLFSWILLFSSFSPLLGGKKKVFSQSFEQIKSFLRESKKPPPYFPSKKYWLKIKKPKKLRKLKGVLYFLPKGTQLYCREEEKFYTLTEGHYASLYPMIIGKGIPFLLLEYKLYGKKDLYVHLSHGESFREELNLYPEVRREIPFRDSVPLTPQNQSLDYRVQLFGTLGFATNAGKESSYENDLNISFKILFMNQAELGVFAGYLFSFQGESSQEEKYFLRGSHLGLTFSYEFHPSPWVLELVFTKSLKYKALPTKNKELSYGASLDRENLRAKGQEVGLSLLRKKNNWFLGPTISKRTLVLEQGFSVLPLNQRMEEIKIGIKIGYTL